MMKKTKLSAILLGALSSLVLISLLEWTKVDSLMLFKVMSLISWACALVFGFNGLRTRNRGWMKFMRLSYGLGFILVILGYAWMML